MSNHNIHAKHNNKSGEGGPVSVGEDFSSGSQVHLQEKASASVIQSPNSKHMRSGVSGEIYPDIDSPLYTNSTVN